MIGANDNELNENGGGSQDPRMTTNASGPLAGATPNQERSFSCGLCDRTFPTNIGRGQHMRQAHFEAYNASIRVDRVKARWSNEETTMMAYEEAQATLNGNVVHMNQHLASVVAHRTGEAIKGKRKQAAYKELVQRYIQDGIEQECGASEVMETEAQNDEEVSVDNHTNDEFDRVITDTINSIVNKQYPHVRKLVEIATSTMSGATSTEASLSKWLRGVFKYSKAPKGPNYTDDNGIEERGKKRRRQEYAMIQKLYKKDFGCAARKVLDGETKVEMPPAKDAIAFWKSVFEPDDMNETSEMDMIEARENGKQGLSNLRELWSPISEEEVRRSELAKGSAPGPDGVTAFRWSRVSLKLRTLFYNIILRRGHLEDELKMARTILIPKGTGAISPENTRPLSITSVVVRQLHKILASRFNRLHGFEPSQRAFIDCDGTLESLTVISTILGDAKLERNEVHIATLDLRKAFDSVHHRTIIETITALGCPRPFTQYITSQYANAQTTLQYMRTNTLMRVNRGVLQGDPLSPLLFNAVMDRAIRAIPKHVGYRLNDVNFNCVAYADDIIIVTSTKLGMEMAIKAFASALMPFGLEINVGKSSTMSLVPSGRDKKMKVITEPQFKINNTYLEPIGPVTLWKYLGVQFRGTRRTCTEMCLEDVLTKIDRAPLKPQQRIRILKIVAIPRFMHALILGRISMSKLQTTDGMIRSYVRKWLRFPRDSPLAYLYASVCDGGLGIPKLTEQVPMIRKQRLERFINKECEISSTFKRSIYIQRQLEWCNRCLAHLGENPTKKIKESAWRSKMLGMVDTKDLAEANQGKCSNSWIESRADEISGGDYVKYHHIRVGCLPSKARTSRGRNKDRSCRAGCRVSETNYHTIQVCHRTHGGRVFRHDRVVELLAGHFRKRDRTQVLVEENFRTPVGLRKPDLLITKNGKTYLIDVQIVSGVNMGRDHATKTNKYRSIDGLHDQIKSKCRSRDVDYHSVTISHKGIVERHTISLFNKLDIPERLRFFVISSVLRGSWLNWNQFNKSTALAH